MQQKHSSDPNHSQSPRHFHHGPTGGGFGGSHGSNDGKSGNAPIIQRLDPSEDKSHARHSASPNRNDLYLQGELSGREGSQADSKNMLDAYYRTHDYDEWIKKQHELHKKERIRGHHKGHHGHGRKDMLKDKEKFMEKKHKEQEEQHFQRMQTMQENLEGVNLINMTNELSSGANESGAIDELKKI